MLFDVIFKKFEKSIGKDSYVVSRIYVHSLSEELRKAQNNGYFIHSVSPVYSKVKSKEAGD